MAASALSFENYAAGDFGDNLEWRFDRYTGLEVRDEGAADVTNPCFSALLRSFFIYLLFVSGLMIIVETRSANGGVIPPSGGVAVADVLSGELHQEGLCQDYPEFG